MGDKRETVLPADSESRKAIPLARGVLDYFPAALAAVAELSEAGNRKHNPGEPLHHARGKSTDHADCILRHLIDRGKVDPEDGIRHSVKTAWRALALLQEELEAEGAPLARGARVSDVEPTPKKGTRRKATAGQSPAFWHWTKGRRCEDIPREECDAHSQARQCDLCPADPCRKSEAKP